jgi:hypothetical protein
MEKKSGISIQTLIISSLAAVAAAVVVPMIWDRGTLFATAMTPVIVAVVSEALRKPAEKITAVTPRVVRRTATGAAVRDPERFDPLPPEERAETAPLRADDPFGLRAKPRGVRHHWRLALATGVAAFVVAVTALTMSELVFGGPATRDSGRTTFFSGSRQQEEATPSATPDATEAPEQAPKATAAPTETATPSPTASPTPTVTVSPTATP